MTSVSNTSVAAATAARVDAATTSGGGGTQAAAGASQLGATALPANGSLQDALVAALKELVTLLSGLLDALRGGALIGGGATSTNQAPTQSPVQSPVQGPTDTSTPVLAGGPTSAPTSTALHPVGNDKVSRMAVHGSTGTMNTTVDMYTGYDIDGTGELKFSEGISDNESEVTFIDPIGGLSRVSIPDTGSVTLSTGTNFAWTSVSRFDTISDNEYNDMSFAVTRSGSTSVFDSDSIAAAVGQGEWVANPLTSLEIVELGRLLAAQYPAAR